MADQASGDSPEVVAFRLMEIVAKVEGKDLDDGARGDADRKYVLDTYAECLLAASGGRVVVINYP